jgi:nitrate/nitrite transporter NarK
VCKPQTLVVVAYAMVAALSALVALLAGQGAAFAAAAIALLLVSGVIQGASFATIPHLTKTAGDQARANGAVAQLGNLGATVGPPVFAAVIGRQGATGLIWLVVVICAGGVLSGAIARKR